MGYLETNFILHRRGADGNLLPIDFTIEKLKMDISITPLTRGEILDNQVKFKNAKDKGIPSNTVWEEIISNHLIITKMSIKELHDLGMIKYKEEVEVEKEIEEEVDINGKKEMQKKIIKEKKMVEKILDPIDLFIDAMYKVSGIDMDNNADIKKNLMNSMNK